MIIAENIFTWFFLGVSVMGAVFLGILAHFSARDHIVSKIIIASYILHVLLAVFLFATSYWDWPVLKSLQMGKGFWQFSIDATGYHVYGRDLSLAWFRDVPLRYPRTPHIEYYVWVGLIYSLLGVNPLYPIFFNCWMIAVNGLLVYVIARKLFDVQSAQISCFLVCFWPSTFIWTSQLLKDPICWFLIMLSTVLIFSLCDFSLFSSSLSSARHAIWSGRARWFSMCVLLGLSTLLMTCFRYYLGIALTLSTLLIFMTKGSWAWFRGYRGHMVGMACIAVVVILATLGGRSVKLAELVVPADLVVPLHIPIVYKDLAAAEGRPSLPEDKTAISQSDPDFILKEVSESAAPNPSILAPVIAEVSSQLEDEIIVSQTQAPSEQGDETTVSQSDPILWIRTGVSKLISSVVFQAKGVYGQVNTKTISFYRRGFVSTGGRSQMDPQARVSSAIEFLTYLPRALTIGFLSPFPWHWFDLKGTTGVMRSFSGIEMILFYALFPVVLINVYRALRRGHTGALYLIFFILILAVSTSSTVSNFGTLFRLRLQFLLPLLIFAASGWPTKLIHHWGSRKRS